MSLSQQIDKAESELRELKQGTNLSNERISDSLEQFFKFGEFEETGLQEAAIDTLYRLSWWLGVYAKSSEQLESPIDLLEGHTSEPLKTSLSQLKQMARSAGEHADFSELTQVAGQLHNASGEELRHFVEQFVHSGSNATQVGQNSEALYQSIPDLLQDIENTLQYYYEHDFEEGTERLPGLLQQLQQVASNIFDIYPNLERAGLPKSQEDLKQVFGDVVKAVENDDHVELPGLLEKELYPLLVQVHGRVEELRASEKAESIFEQNLRAIEERNTGTEEIGKIRTATSDLIEVEFGVADDGGRALKVNTENGDYYISSRFEPRTEAKRWGRQTCRDASGATFIVFGFGVGYRLRELFERISEDAHLLVVIPEPSLFKQVLEVLGCKALLRDERIELFISGEQKNLREVMKEQISWGNLSNVNIAGLPNYSAIFPEASETFVKIVRRQIREEKGHLASHHLQSVRRTKNIIRNVASFATSTPLNQLSNVFEDRPAIVVSAGPSLDKNIDELKGIGQRAVIIAIDTVLPILEEKGIEPHLVVTVDPLEPNYVMNLEETDFEKVRLVASLKSYAEILERHRGERYLLSDPDIEAVLEGVFSDADMDVPDIVSFDEGSSVAHWAYHVADFLGADPIAFIGQDLAFTEGQGYAEGIERSLGEDDTVRIESVDGGTVPTTAEWEVFAQKFEDVIDEQKRVIDATEGGALIPGMSTKPLADVIETYCEESFDPAAKLRDIGAAAETAADAQKLKPVLSSRFQEILDVFKEFEERLLEGIEVAEKLSDLDAEQTSVARAQKIHSGHFLGQLQGLEEELNQSSEIQILVLAINPLKQNLKRKYGDDLRDKEGAQQEALIADKSRYFYEKLLDIVRKVRPAVEKALERVEE